MKTSRGHAEDFAVADLFDQSDPAHLTMSFVADHVALTPSFMVPLVCYAYIAHYRFRGHALR